MIVEEAEAALKPARAEFEAVMAAAKGLLKLGGGKSEAFLRPVVTGELQRQFVWWAWLVPTQLTRSEEILGVVT